MGQPGIRQAEEIFYLLFMRPPVWCNTGSRLAAARYRYKSGLDDKLPHLYNDVNILLSREGGDQVDEGDDGSAGPNSRPAQKRRRLRIFHILS